MLVPVVDFGSNPGALDAYEYVPAGLPSGRPLVVVLHGCTQSASSMGSAGWNAVADADQFAVLYPQQRTANNQLQCFNWFDPADTARDGGEAASIAQMIEHEIAAHGSDPTRVYITGVSAGGAFSAVMMAAYPDKLAAGSIMAGLAYGCGSDVSSAQSCMSGNVSKTAMQWGDLVRTARPGYSGPWPRVQIWQGSTDLTVNPKNATALVEQWTNVWGTDAMPETTQVVDRATYTSYSAGATTPVELYTIANMGHGVAIGTDALGTCPASIAPYFLDVGVCSTLHTAAFFGLQAPADLPPGNDSSDGCSATRRAPSWLVLVVAGVLAGRGRKRRATPASRRRSGSHHRPR